jgi:hypothetical protein
VDGRLIAVRRGRKALGAMDREGADQGAMAWLLPEGYQPGSAVIVWAVGEFADDCPGRRFCSSTMPRLA